ncbi:MAG: hypothetical protein NXI32_08955 [bacterium]|nr:hypothetical protein [bacterium]
MSTETGLKFLCVLCCSFLLMIGGPGLAQDTTSDVPDFDTSEMNIELPEEFEDFTEGDFGAVEETAEEQATADTISLLLTGGALVVAFILALLLFRKFSKGKGQG